MKILHTADWHLGKKLYHIDRLPEQIEVLNEIINIADKNSVDIILIAGDIFDTINPSSEVTEVLYKTLKKLSNNGDRPIIAIAGNHDSPDRIAAPDPLAKECGIIFIGYPLQQVSPYKISPKWNISESDAGWIKIKFENGEKINLITTSYTNELRLKQYLGKDEDEGIRHFLSKKWQEITEGWMNDKSFNILLAHLLIWDRNNQQSPSEDEGEKSIKIGNASIIYSDLIPNNIHYTALGHLHRKQKINGTNHPCFYSGSILPYSFSEAGQKKSVQIISTQHDEITSLESIQLSSGIPLIRLSVQSYEDAFELVNKHNNCHIELTIELENFLTVTQKKELQNATNNLLLIIPIINKKSKDNSNIGIIQNQFNSINEEFSKYFEEKTGKQPDESFISLFNEILNQHNK